MRTQCKDNPRFSARMYQYVPESLSFYHFLEYPWRTVGRVLAAYFDQNEIPCSTETRHI